MQSYDNATRELIRGKINGLIKFPPEGDIKPLQGAGTQKRLRVGKYRIIFEYLHENSVKILMINKIDTRGGVYK